MDGLGDVSAEAEEWAPLEVGKTYHVEWSDCCTAGEFTSELVSIGGGRLELKFANGVTMDYGAKFDEVTFS